MIHSMSMHLHNLSFKRSPRMLGFHVVTGNMRSNWSVRHLFPLSTLRVWFSKCWLGKFLFDGLGSGTIIATRDDPQLYSISYRPNLPHELTPLGKGRSPYGSVRVVGHAPSLERALQAGDKFAEKKLGRGRCLAWVLVFFLSQPRFVFPKKAQNWSKNVPYRLLRYAPWRQRLASENAIKHLLKRLGEDNDSLLDGQGKERVISLWGKKVSVGSLTAGEVSSWLCAMKNGAKVSLHTIFSLMTRTRTGLIISTNRASG